MTNELWCQWFSSSSFVCVLYWKAIGNQVFNSCMNESDCRSVVWLSTILAHRCFACMYENKSLVGAFASSLFAYVYESYTICTHCMYGFMTVWLAWVWAGPLLVSLPFSRSLISLDRPRSEPKKNLCMSFHTHTRTHTYPEERKEDSLSHSPFSVFALMVTRTSCCSFR